jgi:hypothetical protein
LLLKKGLFVFRNGLFQLNEDLAPLEANITTDLGGTITEGRSESDFRFSEMMSIYSPLRETRLGDCKKTDFACSDRLNTVNTRSLP